jgi:hypothetical protein
VCPWYWFTEEKRARTASEPVVQAGGADQELNVPRLGTKVVGYQGRGYPVTPAQRA